MNKENEITCYLCENLFEDEIHKGKWDCGIIYRKKTICMGCIRGIFQLTHIGDIEELETLKRNSVVKK